MFRRALIASIALCLVVPLGGTANAAPPSPAADLAIAAARPSDPVDYAYDAAGRLVGVSQTNTGANTGRYNYDDSGNLLSIDRFASTTLSLLSMVPARAQVGATITLSGTAFAATPAGNTVKFNGTTATVSAATTRTLTVAVPTGATTGPITVTTSAGTATSSKPFTVDATANPPTVTGFSPALSAERASVTITGTGFDAASVVSFGKTRGVVTAATSTSLTVTVPDAAGSGPITVVTANGVASSSTDFVAVPGRFAAFETASTPVLVVDGAATTVATPASKVSVMRFTGTKGQRLSLGLTGSTMTDDVLIEGFTPFGAPFARDELDVPWKLNSLDRGIELPPLPQSGVYQFVLDPFASGAGSVTVTLSSRVTGTLNPTGAASVVALSRPGQLAELTFPATAGKNLNLGFTASTFPAGTVATVSVREPNGAWMFDRTLKPRSPVALNGFDLDLPTSQTGNYTVLFGTSNQSTGSVTVTASTSIDGGVLTLGNDLTATSSRPGQDVEFRYAGTAGQVLSLDFPAISSQFGASVTVTAPDGSVVAAAQSSVHVDVPALPVTGTYLVTVSTFSSSGSGSMTLRATLRQDAGTLTPTGAATSVTLAQPGRTAVFQFAATAGQTVNLGLIGWALPAGASLRGQVLDPQGAKVYGSPGLFPLSVITIKATATGTYRLLLSPSGATATSNGSVTMSTQIAGGALTIGTTKTVTASRAGQSTALTFTGAVGQRPSLTFSSFAFASNVILQVARPDGTVFRDEFLASFQVDLEPLTVAGTYEVRVLPQAETGSVQLTLNDRVDAGSTTVGGATKTLSITQTARFAETSFTATAGQRVDFGFTGWTFASGTHLRARVLDSTGAAVNETDLVDTGSIFTTVGAAGTYRLIIAPIGFGTGAVTLTLSQQIDAGTITLNTNKVLTFPRVGQTSRVTFSGVAGQRLALTMPTMTTPFFPFVQVLKSDNSVLFSDFGGASVALPALPTTGTYTFVLSPFSFTGSVTVNLTTAAAARKSAPADKSQGPRSIPAPPMPPSPPVVKQDPLPPLGLVTAAEAASTSGPTWTPDQRNLAGDDWNTHRPALSGKQPEPLRAAAGTTALSGRALTLDGRGLAGVTVSIDAVKAKTDGSGRFLLSGVGAGHRVLRVDGASANSEAHKFGLFDIGVDLTAGQTAVLPYPVWMSALDTANNVKFTSPADREVVLTTPAIPGLEVRLPKGAVIRDVGGKVVTELGITAIPVDRPPFPLPQSQVPSYFTVQPGSSYVFPTGARVVYPNFTHAAPGDVMDFWHYDPADRGWFVYGHGKVTPDGKQVVPDAGTEVYQFTGAMLISPGSPAPPEKAGVPGESTTAGDPVNLSTGLLVDTVTDLSIDDTIPISITRTYQHSDTARRAFGVGVGSDYNTYLYANQQWVDGQLILPDGGRVKYHRITPGSTGFNEYATAAFAADPTPTIFSGSVMAWNGNGFDVRLRDGTTYVFGEEAPLQAIRDKFGNTVTITRDSAVPDSDGRVRAKGPITQVTSPNGKWISFTNNTNGQVTQARDNAGRTVDYTYDGTGHLSTVTDATGSVTTYTYDSAGRMATAKDGRNTVYLTNTYDSAGRVRTQTAPDTGVHTFDYVTGTGGKITETRVTDPRGFVRKVTFNTAGFATSDTAAFGNALARTTTITRDSTTNVITSTTDPLGRRTDLGYDAFANVTSITQAAGTSLARTVQARYEGPFDQLSKITDWLGKDTVYGYHPNGALKTVADPIGRTTTTDVLETGQIKTLTDTAGKNTGYAYALGDLVTVTDPLGRATRLTSDTISQLVAVRDPAGSISRSTYDKQGRVLSTVDPLGRSTSYTYDANGNLKTVTDPRSKTTTYTYDLMSRVKTATDPLNRVTTYDYDLNGNPTSNTGGRGKVTLTEFDALNRPTLVRFGATGTAEESRTTYGYDLADRLKTVTDSAAGVTTFTLNDRDQLTKSVTPQGTLDYTYDAARRTTMTAPGQAQVVYGYNDASQPTTLTRGSEVVTIGYDTAGRRKTVTLPNAVVQTYGYDDASRLTSIGYTRNTTTLGTLTHDYTPAGQLGHLGGTYARADIPNAYGPATYDDANQVIKVGTTVYAYDNDGNQTTDGTTASTWNARGQLATTTRPGQTSTYAYDGLGRRIAKTAGGTTTGYLHDGNNVIQELAGTTPTANLLTGGLDEVFTRTSGGVSRSLLTDHLGSTLATTDTTGTVTGEYGYQPFGATTLTGDDGGNPTRFTGREDDGNNQYFHRGRSYNTTDQRFLSQDPIGFAGGDSNLYAYVGNQPTAFTDPMGTNPKSITASTHSGNSRAREGVERLFERTYEVSPGYDPQAYVEAIAQRYGINLRGSGQRIEVLYDPKLPSLGLTKGTDGGLIVRVGPNALAGGDAEVANTIAHELTHARYYLRNKTFDGQEHGHGRSMADGTPYGSGNALQEWIEGKR
ncbi:RHS repeat-associated core domain-containing protein [Umezawaea sp. NPDC059074]|uniref:RHS repeat-associated core domain-containing protein n=1 Tax=Umezawaea sp. NPDC059074 TaxID=3346716 RepID=UPI0036821FD0